MERSVERWSLAFFVCVCVCVDKQNKICSQNGILLSNIQE